MDIIENVIKTKATRKNVRLMIPILIHWAKTGQTHHTYGDMTTAMGMKRFSGIGHPLGKIQEVFNSLKVESGHSDIPTLNCLIKNPKEDIPADGFSYVFPDYKNFSLEQKKSITKGLEQVAIEYKHWDWVLDQLGLQEYRTFSEDELKTIRNPHTWGGGEGQEHKLLKEYICNHPEVVGYKNVVLTETEHILPSGDRLDVYFELKDGTHVAIEVKPSIAPESDIMRGLFQCVKYKAVMSALRTIESSNYDIDVLLVTPQKISSVNKRVAEELNVNCIENINDINN